MTLKDCAYLLHNVMQRELTSEQLTPMRQHLDNGEPCLAIQTGLDIGSRLGYEMQRILKRHT